MNKTKDYELSIIIPVYNEEDNLDRVEKELSAFLPHALVRSCVLFVNDGSRDTSLDRIKAICSRHDDFFYISSTANHGLSTAMKRRHRCHRESADRIYRLRPPDESRGLQPTARVCF